MIYLNSNLVSHFKHPALVQYNSSCSPSNIQAYERQENEMMCSTVTPFATPFDMQTHTPQAESAHDPLFSRLCEKLSILFSPTRAAAMGSKKQRSKKAKAAASSTNNSTSTAPGSKFDMPEKTSESPFLRLPREVISKLRHHLLQPH